MLLAQLKSNKFLAWVCGYGFREMTDAEAVSCMQFRTRFRLRHGTRDYHNGTFRVNQLVLGRAKNALIADMNWGLSMSSAAQYIVDYHGGSRYITPQGIYPVVPVSEVSYTTPWTAIDQSYTFSALILHAADGAAYSLTLEQYNQTVEIELELRVNSPVAVTTG